MRIFKACGAYCRSAIQKPNAAFRSDQEFTVLRKTFIASCAGLALACTASAQVVTYMSVGNVTHGIMLFDAHDGSLINQSFIPKTGPMWSMGTLKGAVQINNEIWIPDQSSAVWRFDLNGNYYGKITENMNNIRGAMLIGDTVYVSNNTAAGQTPANSVIRFGLDGTYQGAFGVNSSPYDFFPLGNDEFLLSHSGGSPDIGRYNTSGAYLGVFHDGPMQFAQQISRKPNGNFLVASFTTGRIHELDSSGFEVAQSPAVSSGRGAHVLGNGNVLCTGGTSIYIWDPIANTLDAVWTGGTTQYVKPITIDMGAVGACCMSDNTCQVLSITACGSQGGIFRGDGVSCANPGCPPLGACCFADGTCAQMRLEACEASDGLWSGGVNCAASGCTPRLVTPPGSANLATAGAGVFFDLTALADVSLHRIDYWPGTAAGNAVVVDIYTKPGSYIGFDDDPNAWMHLTTFTTTSAGNSASSPMTMLALPSAISMVQNETLGVYLVGTTGGIRYRASTSADPVFDANLSLSSERTRTALFGGTLNTSRRFAGAVHYQTGSAPCYANCDGSTQPPVLNVADFSCFLQKFAAADPYANCDGSTQPPVLNVADFSCFLQKFAAGCP
jgi:hypothetical protein